MTSPAGDEPPPRYAVGEFARPFGYPLLDRGEHLELSENPRVVGHFLDHNLAEAVAQRLEAKRE
jgi:hypothetical protein